MGLVIRQRDGDALSIGKKVFWVEVNPEKGARLVGGKRATRWMMEGDSITIPIKRGIACEIVAFRHTHETVSFNITVDRTVKIERH